MIHTLRRQWQHAMLVTRLLIALGVALVAGVLLYRVQGSLWWMLPIGAGSLLALLLPRRAWRIRLADAVRYLNTTIPAMEESSGLLLKPPHSLGLLEQLQVRRIAPVLQEMSLPRPYRRQLRTAAWFFVGAVAVSIALLQWRPPFPARYAPGRQGTEQAGRRPSLPPAIAAATITITPPAYTRKTPRSQQPLDLEVEEGAHLHWQLRTSRPLRSLQLLLNDSVRLPLQANAGDSTQWSGAYTVHRPGFYQVLLEGQASELYKLAVLKDRPPLITVQSPPSYTVIDYGQPQQVTVKVRLADDYGITAAGIQATVASGSGEAVKFKEQPLPFAAAFNGTRTQYALEKTIRLPVLGMQPGSELYFYVQAQDNHGQHSRSGVYMVVLPDTAQLMELEGLANSVTVKPEYFRSQRQIIIETEQLIRARDTLPEKTFKNRGNELGIDQRLLRLRYGRFLGEESETNIGDDRAEAEEEHDHDHDHDHAAETAGDARDFNNADKIIEQFSHRHDIAEDATFFDPETKRRLKAVLTEMWNAELHLRTFRPQEALPYEYKALRLLKDLQQRSRAYVAKTSIKTAPLKPEKRLSGELGKIIVPVAQHSYVQASAHLQQLGYALSVLETLQNGGAVTDPVSLQVLQQAAQQLSARATDAPARYLSSLQALRRVLAALQQQEAPLPADITTAAQTIYSLLPPPEPWPQADGRDTGIHLSQQYFMNLYQSPKE